MAKGKISKVDVFKLFLQTIEVILRIVTMFK